MEKSIIVSLTLALLLFAGSSFTPCNAQAPSKDDTPTFYRLVPGTYVNGWPRFTVRYPKEWPERPPLFQEVFRAGVTGPGIRTAVHVTPDPMFPPDKVAEANLAYAKNQDKNATLVADKPTRLPDGTPARETEVRWVTNSGTLDLLCLALWKHDTGINVGVAALDKLTDDLKAIPYSIEFQPEKDKPVTVPPDLQTFLDKYSSAVLSHDIEKVMSCFSDRFLNSRMKKGEWERVLKPAIDRSKSFGIVITDFIPARDQACLTEFTIEWIGKLPLWWTSIIKENGQWKWHGNQK
jgi:hypothetical protein